MPISRPQSDLPRSVSGGSDAWDKDKAGELLNEDFFDTETVTTTETLMKYWNGSAWISKPLKIFKNSTWETPTLNRRDASTWDKV